jgi:hypothetical protein
LKALGEEVSDVEDEGDEEEEEEEEEEEDGEAIEQDAKAKAGGVVRSDEPDEDDVD